MLHLLLLLPRIWIVSGLRAQSLRLGDQVLLLQITLHMRLCWSLRAGGMLLVQYQVLLLLQSRPISSETVLHRAVWDNAHGSQEGREVCCLWSRKGTRDGRQFWAGVEHGGDAAGGGGIDSERQLLQGKGARASAGSCGGLVGSAEQHVVMMVIIFSLVAAQNIAIIFVASRSVSTGKPSKLLWTAKFDSAIVCYSSIRVRPSVE
mmetsp:Transcript_17057/g.38790  ORF Transcript_17057/g.38790 Transcript_17057/m.38790 type:complete len:205 (+) Transcript_17057:95-709(+)